MSGSIVFLPHSELTTGRGTFSCRASSLPSLSPPLSLKISESSFIICSSSLKKNFPPSFFPLFVSLPLRSKPRGRWHPPAPLRLLPSVHLLSLQTPLAPSFNPSFFSFVRHRIRIYKSRLTPLQKPSSKSLQAATVFVVCEKLEVQNTHTRAMGTDKGVSKKRIFELVWSGFLIEGGEKTERGCWIRRNFGVYS